MDWTPGNRGGFGGQDAPAGQASTVAPKTAPPPSIETIPFDVLPAATRAALPHAKPILKGNAKGGGKMFFACVGVLASVAVLFMYWKHRFGSPYEPKQEFGSLLVYGGALFFMTFLGLWVARRFIQGNSPFKPGRYVYCTGLVISDGATITSLPLALVTKINTVHQYVNGAYSSTTIHFIFPGRTESFPIHRDDNVGARMDATRAQLRDALAAGDLATARLIDPLIDGIIDPSWGDVAAMEARWGGEGAAEGPKAGGTPKWLGLVPRLGIATVVALLAIPIFFTRNALADDAAFEEAVRDAERPYGGLYSLRAYARNGGNRAAEVETEHIPRIVLQQAEESGEVTPLREFLQEYGGTPFAARAREIIHQRFETVRANFLSQASTKGEVRTFMNALLAWLEAHDSPPVQVRYAPPSTETLAEMDQVLRRRARRIIPVAPHFSVAHTQRRESSVTRSLGSGFATVFPADVMTLEHGGHATGTAAAVPTIDVTYVIAPSGAIYVSERDGRQFVGIQVNFHVAMAIPDSPETYAFDVHVEPPERFSVSYQTYGGVGNMSEGQVYSTMAERAFDQLTSELGLAFFAQGSEAHQAAERRSQQAAPPRPNLGSTGPGSTGNPLLDPRFRDLLDMYGQ